MEQDNSTKIPENISDKIAEKIAEKESQNSLKNSEEKNSKKISIKNLTITESLDFGLKRLFDFKGRSTRLEFWAYFIAMHFSVFVVSFFAGAGLGSAGLGFALIIFLTSFNSDFSIFAVNIIFFLSSFIISVIVHFLFFAISIRRIRDAFNKKFFIIFPIIGIITNFCISNLFGFMFLNNQNIFAGYFPYILYFQIGYLLFLAILFLFPSKK